MTSVTTGILLFAYALRSYTVYVAFSANALRHERRANKLAVEGENDDAGSIEMYGPQRGEAFKSTLSVNSLEDVRSERMPPSIRSDMLASVAAETAPPSYRSRSRPSLLPRRYSDSSAGGGARSSRFSVAESSLLTGFEASRVGVCKHCHGIFEDDEGEIMHDTSTGAGHGSPSQPGAPNESAATRDVHPLVTTSIEHADIADERATPNSQQQ